MANQEEQTSTDSARLKSSVQQFWDNQPCGVINTQVDPGTRAFYEETEAVRYAEEYHIPEEAEFDSHPGERVLEIGCGLGTDGRRFAQGGANYVGCDLSLRSLELARKGFEAYGLPGQFVSVDGENLPFEDGSFDVVYSHGVLHHIPDTQRAIDEVRRVLRKDGKAIIMLYALESFGFTVGAQTYGRARLEWARLRMGKEAFNKMVGLPLEHKGWLPTWIVTNNSTDGVGNPLSKLYSRGHLREMFSEFRDVQFHHRYFPRRKVPIIGPRLPRFMTDLLGATMGNYWYIKALK